MLSSQVFLTEEDFIMDKFLDTLQPAFPNCVTIITRKTAITIDI